MILSVFLGSVVIGFEFIRRGVWNGKIDGNR